MAHAGEKMVFRFVQFFDLLFLLFGEFVFLIIKPCQKQKQNAGQRTHQDDGGGGIEEGMVLSIVCGKLRKIKSYVIAKKGFGCTDQKKYGFPPSDQG